MSARLRSPLAIHCILSLGAFLPACQPQIDLDDSASDSSTSETHGSSTSLGGTSTTTLDPDSTSDTSGLTSHDDAAPEDSGGPGEGESSGEHPTDESSSSTGEVPTDESSSSGDEEPERVDPIVNGGFEDGRENWSVFGFGSFTVSDEQAHSGSYSGVTTDRRETYDSIMYDLSSAMLPGWTYDISIWVRIENMSSADFSLALRRTCPLGGSDASYTFLETVTVNDVEWTQVATSYTVEDCDEDAEMLLFFDAPIEATVYIDDLVVI